MQGKNVLVFATCNGEEISYVKASFNFQVLRAENLRKLEVSKLCFVMNQNFVNCTTKPYDIETDVNLIQVNNGGIYGLQNDIVAYLRTSQFIFYRLSRLRIRFDRNVHEIAVLKLKTKTFSNFQCQQHFSVGSPKPLSVSDSLPLNPSCLILVVGAPRSDSSGPSHDKLGQKMKFLLCFVNVSVREFCFKECATMQDACLYRVVNKANCQSVCA